MVDEERIKELEAIDRKFNFRRKATVVFFVFLSFLLVIYAVHIERKIQNLSQKPAVVVYVEPSGTSASYPADDESLPSEDNFSSSDAQSEVERIEISTEKAEEITVVKENQEFEDEHIYYVTATGRKYHKAGCSYLTDTAREASVDDLYSGRYTPCSRCIKE